MLGMLVATSTGVRRGFDLEHVNSFDQWGVELGKQLAKALLPKVQAAETAVGYGSSARGLVQAYLSLKA